MSPRPSLESPTAFEQRREGVLGTRWWVRLAGVGRFSSASRIERRMIEEAQRLERVFSVFSADSEVSRWRLGAAVAPPGSDLGTVLIEAERWRQQSRGAFSPLSGAISERWRQAEREGRFPPDQALVELVESTNSSLFEVEAGGGLRARPTAVGLTLNAIAKGYIIDRCVEVGRRHASDVVVNLGGDLRHSGSGSVTVGIEDPRRAFDNAIWLDRVVLSNAALATSGGSRRGFNVAGEQLSHVIDPRTARPVDAVLSASVVAADAMTADAVATVVSVMQWPEAHRWLRDHEPELACAAVDRNGSVSTTSTWSSLRPT